MASGGMTLPLIGALLGHTDTASTARYAHLADSSRHRAAGIVSGEIAAKLIGQASPGIGGQQAQDAAPATVLPFVRKA